MNQYLLSGTSWAAAMIAVAGCSATAYAADAAPAAGSAAPADAADIDMHEIVVTAQKRSEALSRVPIAITALSNQQLQQRGVTSIFSMVDTTPGVTFDNHTGVLLIFLRGIGADYLQPLVNMSVPVYYDGVVVPFPTGIDRSFIDVERIEVVKGPQGVLFGRNSIGGAINIITRQPPEKATFEGQLRVGNYNLIETQGFAGGPITDNVRVSVAGSYSNRSSYYHNIAGPKIQDNNQYNVKGKVLVTNNDSLDLLLTASRFHASLPDNYAFRQFQAGSAGGLAGGILPTKPFDVSLTQPLDAARGFNNVDQLITENFYGAKIDADLGAVHLVSLTGYRESINRNIFDLDWTNAPGSALDSKIRENTFTQEFQLLSNNDSPFQWVAGAYYFDTRGGNVDQKFQAAPSPNILYRTTRGISKAYAGFAQGTYKFTDTLSLIAGARYTRDELTLIGRSDNFTGPYQGPPFIGGRKDSSTNFAPKLSVQYDNGRTLLYATYSKAYKAGVYNISTVDANPANNAPVKPEHITAYEVGVKTKIGNIARFELAAYHYDYTDIQIQLSVGGGILRLENVCCANFDGVEASGSLFLGNLTLDGAMSYLARAKYSRYNPASAYVQGGGASAAAPNRLAIGLDFTGNRTPRAPKLTAALGADYKIPLDSGAKINVNGNLAYSSKEFFSAANDPQSARPKYTRINAGIRYTSPDDKWSAGLWANNLTNKAILTSKLINPNSTYGAYAPPRTYGVTLGYKM